MDHCMGTITDSMHQTLSVQLEKDNFREALLHRSDLTVSTSSKRYSSSSNCSACTNPSFLSYDQQSLESASRTEVRFSTFSRPIRRRADGQSLQRRHWTPTLPWPSYFLFDGSGWRSQGCSWEFRAREDRAECPQRRWIRPFEVLSPGKNSFKWAIKQNNYTPPKPHGLAVQRPPHKATFFEIKIIVIYLKMTQVTSFIRVYASSLVSWRSCFYLKNPPHDCHLSCNGSLAFLLACWKSDWAYEGRLLHRWHWSHGYWDCCYCDSYCFCFDLRTPTARIPSFPSSTVSGPSSTPSPPPPMRSVHCCCWIG